MKKVVSMALAASMIAAAVMPNAAGAAEVSHDEELTLEVYDVAANYQGIQNGWYAKILKDKFNLVQNIIAPQVSGDSASLYQTRCASGNLGDIVILDNADMLDCVDAGLIMDLSADLEGYPNLMKYQEQINQFNAGIGDGTGIYAIPCQMNSIGPTAYVEDTVYSCARIPWDLYSEQGAPELTSTQDLLDLLAKIQEAHPTNEAGDHAYALSLWSDWDGTSISNVNEITKWYGQEVNGSVLIGTDNTITPLTDKDGAYYKMLHFLYEANQMGLVDPDSATQDWNAACEKMQQKRVYLFWYNWQRGFWNTPENGAAGENYVAVPLSDMNVYQTSATYYGDGRVWGLGSGVDEDTKARILEYLDWLCTPEALTYQHVGQEGLIYTVNEDGTYSLTADGFNRFTSDLEVPEELGGGLWQDGQNQVNQWIVAAIEENTETGESYTPDLWASTQEANQTKTTIEWSERFDGAANEVEYLKEKGLMTTVASVNIALEADNTDIALMRSQCGNVVCDSSWRMIFAADDAEFDEMWDAMCTQLEGFGWDQVVEFDTAKYQPVITARAQAAE